MSAHCAKHCIRPANHEWGKCVGPDKEQWYRICPRCDEAERIVAGLDEYDENEDIAVRAAIRIARGET